MSDFGATCQSRDQFISGLQPSLVPVRKPNRRRTTSFSGSSVTKQRDVGSHWMGWDGTGCPTGSLPCRLARLGNRELPWESPRRKRVKYRGLSPVIYSTSAGNLKAIRVLQPSSSSTQPHSSLQLLFNCQLTRVYLLQSSISLIARQFTSERC